MGYPPWLWKSPNVTGVGKCSNMFQLNITQLLEIYNLQQIFEGDIQNPPKRDIYHHLPTPTPRIQTFNRQLLELKLSLQVTKARTAAAQREQRGMGCRCAREPGQAMVPCCESVVKMWWKYGEHLKTVVKWCEINRTWKFRIVKSQVKSLHSVFQFDDDQLRKLVSDCWKYPRWACVKHQIGLWLQLCMPYCSSFLSSADHFELNSALMSHTHSTGKIWREVQFVLTTNAT